MPDASSLRLKIFADGADKSTILKLAENTAIQGFTTNPTLMRKAGVSDYEAFCREVLAAVPDRSFSFEVFSDDFEEMERQALRIASWGPQVYVKVPITNTCAESAGPLIGRLASQGVKLNVTAIMTVSQVETTLPYLSGGPPSYVSVFAGRVADAGCDPVPVMRAVLDHIRPFPQIELIWASPREVFNIVQADDIGCHIITVTNELLAKLPLLGRSLEDFSLDTVKMFRNDAVAAGYSFKESAYGGTPPRPLNASTLRSPRQHPQ